MYKLYQFSQALNIKFKTKKSMSPQILMLLMSALGAGLALNTITSKMNTRLFQASTWIISAILSQSFK